MKKLLYNIRYIGSRLFLLVMTVLTLTNCEMRSVLSELPGGGNGDVEGADFLIIVDVDWSLLDEEPTGMSLFFYPSDGSIPYIRRTNNVHHYEVKLPEDDYDLIVFNQSETEFSFLEFGGLDKFETAEAHAIETPDIPNRVDRLFGLPKQNGDNTRAKVTNATLKPNGFGSISTTIKNGAAVTRAKVYNATLKPPPSIGQMNVSIRVQGLTRNPTATAAAVEAVNGALTGLAGGFLMGKGEPMTYSITQELEDWSINYCESETDIGSITTSFGTFGISPTVDYTRVSDDADNTRTEDGVRSPSDLTYIEESDDDDIQNFLYLNFRLTDGTYVPYRFNVTHRIVERDEIDGTIVVSINLELDLGISVSGVDDGLDDPLILPSHGLPHNSWNIGVKDWGDGEVIDVNI